jgi:hypothetical protein
VARLVAGELVDAGLGEDSGQRGGFSARDFVNHRLASCLCQRFGNRAGPLGHELVRDGAGVGWGGGVALVDPAGPAREATVNLVSDTVMIWTSATATAGGVAAAATVK